MTGRKVRPALYHINLPPKHIATKFAVNWQWASLKEVAEISGIASGDLLRHFVEFKARETKHRGVCIAVMDNNGEKRTWTLLSNFGQVSHNTARFLQPDSFFWRKFHIEDTCVIFKGDGGLDFTSYPGQPHVSVAACANEIAERIFVPSGWANGVLDEIERRRKAGEPILQRA